MLKYFREVLKLSLMSKGARRFMVFKELGDADPAKIWTLTAFPDWDSFNRSMRLQDDDGFVARSEEYINAGTIYSRITSSLLLAISGLPQMKDPFEGAGLFELRIYEGMNEDAVRRKIKMFNVEELDLFYRLDMQPIFFGDMRIGPYVPSLVYMLNFKDMDHRNEAWGNFIRHPEWKSMSTKKEYANTVSNIRKIFLQTI